MMNARCVFFLSVSSVITCSLYAQDALPTEEELAKEQAQAVEFAKQRDAHAAKVQDLLAQRQTRQRELSTLKKTLKSSEAKVAKAEETLKPLNEAVSKTQAEKEKTDKALEAAKQAAEGAKGTDQEKAKADELKKAEEAAAANKKLFDDAQAALTSAQQKIDAAKKTVESSPAEITKTEEAIAVTQKSIDSEEVMQAQKQAAWVTHQQNYQRGMIAHGKMVSFAEKVAPIFSKRCLACHNARTAKGRYNMENYAAILKGGESGEAVDIGEGDLSTLYIMIEDGSMPKDADPLTAEELALVKKWIDTGAMLDAEFSASAELITIVPKLPQPSPPEKYRVTVPVTALAFSPDGKSIASAGYHEVLVWSSENGQLERRISNLAERIYDIEFSPDGQTIAVAAGTPAQLGEVKLFQYSDGKLLADLIRTGDSVFAVSFSPDGTKLVCGCADRSIRLYDIASSEELLVIEDHADWVIDIAWSPDGTKLASASRDKTSKVFDVASGDSLVTFNSHNETVSGVGFKADGSQVVTAGADKQIRIWNVADAKQARNISGFGDEIFRVIITPEGEVFSVSADKSSRRHKIDNGQSLKTYSGHSDWIYSLARHAGSKRIATGSYDGVIKVWNEDEAKVLTEWIAAPGLQP